MTGRRLLMIGLGAIAGAAGWLLLAGPRKSPAPTPAAPRVSVDVYCASCHKLPPPDSLPRAAWKSTVESMYAMAGQTKDSSPPGAPPLEETVRRFEDAAPVRLPPSMSTVGIGGGPIDLQVIPLKLGGVPPFAGTANVRFTRLSDATRLDLLVSDMRFGMILAMQPYESLGTIRLLGKAPHPCHAEVVDLDGDGVRDILAADLGTVTPSDVTQGSIVWLRGTEKSFEAETLIAGRGRIAEAQAADFDLDGDQDVVAAVFGWRRVGEILLLDNRGGPKGRPQLIPYEVDPRPGAIHVPVADLDGDGLPDFVALISQHHECVVAFMNRGKLRFDARPLYEAPHPGWGFSGMQLVDFDGDGDLDICLANGDTLDNLILKPYHGLSWLENRGDLRFELHRLTDLHGAHGIRAADLDQDGDLDVLGSVFIPWLKKDAPGAELADTIIWLERRSDTVFTRHSLEAVMSRHPTIDAGDFDADGDTDIAVGNMTMAKGADDAIPDWVLLFKNLGKKEKR